MSLAALFHHLQHLSFQEVCLFQLIGVILALTPEEHVKDSEEQRRCTGVKNLAITLDHAPSGRSSVRCARGKKMTTDLAEHRGSVLV